MVTRRWLLIWILRLSACFARERKTTSAAQINDLFLMKHSKIGPGYLVHPNTSVEVVCIWENSDPPVKARLLDRTGEEIINATSITQQIRYTFRAVRCQDSGVIHCEAPGASKNATLSLLVRCPPKMTLDPNEVHVPAGENLELRVAVRSYTTDITECLFYEVYRSERSRAAQQCDLSRLIGTPPDLNLTVWLDDVKKEDEGEWLLKLANDMGTASLQFRIRVIASVTAKHKDGITVQPTISSDWQTSDEVSSATHNTAAGDTEPGQDEDLSHQGLSEGNPATGAAIGVVVVLGLVVGTVAFILVKRSRRATAVLRENRLANFVFFRRCNEVHSEHIYEDARPISMPQEPAPRPVPCTVSCRPTPKPRKKLTVSSDDYLNPLPAATDLTDNTTTCSRLTGC